MNGRIFGLLSRSRRHKPPVSRRPQQQAGQKQSAFHYSSNRSQTERSRRETAEPGSKTDWLKKPAYILGALLVIAGVAYFSTLSAATTVNVAGKSQPLRQVSEYQDFASQTAGKGTDKYSKFTINRDKIAGEIESKYPEVESAKVKTPFFARAATVELKFSKPAVELATNNGNYVLDNRGIALVDLKSANKGFKTNGLILINDQTGTSIELGKPALTSAQVAFVNELKHQSEAKKMPLASVTLSGGGGELNIKHGNLPYFVKYNFYEDARKSFGTFLATKEHLEGSKQVPTEYIDVRLPERAYIK